MRWRESGSLIEFEYCDTPEKSATGLQFRPSLPADRVLVFDDPKDGTWQMTYFHMHNVRFPIAIAGLDPNGVVLKLQRIEPETGRFYIPRKCVRVVEMNVDFPARHGVEIGRPFPSDAPSSPDGPA
jgi:uncharacterized membrane protein (UPF0127 family)